MSEEALVLRNQPRRSTAFAPLLFTLIAGPAAPAAQGQRDPLRVEIANARSVPCEDREVAPGRNLKQADQCFAADAVADLELRLESDKPEGLRTVVQSVVGGSTSYSQNRAAADSLTFTGSLPLPRAAIGPATPTPNDLELFLLGDKPPLKPLELGHYLIELEAGTERPPHRIDGPERVLHRMLLGMTITSSGKWDSLLQWPVADGRARLAFSGCFERSHDPVVELVLTACDDPQYQVKAATVDPRGKASLEQMVENSLRAYEKIWLGVSRRDEPGPPPAIVLELEQVLDGQHHALQKHFVALRDRFLVVTFYGPKGEQERLRSRFGPRSDWLLLAR